MFREIDQYRDKKLLIKKFKKFNDDFDFSFIFLIKSFSISQS